MNDPELNGQTDYEIDFTDENTNPLDYWCVKFGLKQRETASGESRTVEYKGVPKNQGTSFKFKIDCGKPYMKTSDLNEDETEGLYHKVRFIHTDSAGKIWFVEKETEEQIFETTLHEHD